MNSFESVGWSIWITVASLGGVVFCLYVLISQLRGQPKKGETISEIHGKVYRRLYVEILDQLLHMQEMKYGYMN